MKTRKQIAEEIHNELLKKLVLLNNQVQYLRFENKEKEKNKLVIERDSIEIKLRFLEKEEKL